MKKMLSLATFLVAAVIIGTGCEKESPTAEIPSGPSHVIAVIPKLTNTVFWQSVLAGAQEAGKDMAIKFPGMARIGRPIASVKYKS